MTNATFIFCDIVGFSKNDDEFQAQLICDLNAEVTHFLARRLSDPEPSVIFLPTGDGLAIALLEKNNLAAGSSKADVTGLVGRLMQFAAGRSGRMPLRIGVHRGPVSLVRDINGRTNVCGTALNDCQRIMNAARPNQVLISSYAYRSLVGDAQPLHSVVEKSALKFSEPISILAKHRLEFEVRIMFREGEPGWERIVPCPQGLMIGKKKRTQFIVKHLNELFEHPENPVTIYEQSAFSTFGIPPEESSWGPDTEYKQLIGKQKLLLRTLAEQGNTTLKLLICPIRTYSPEWQRARCEALLTCLEAFRNSPNVAFALITDSQVPNRLIVRNSFSLDGYKMYDSSGYELSVLWTKTDEIDEAIEKFERIFERQRSRYSPDDIIDHFKQLRDKYAEPK